MSKPETLFDALQMEAVSRKSPYHYLDATLRRARCFVLDDGMSEFLAVLATQAFHELTGTLKKTFHRDDERGSGVTVEGTDEQVEVLMRKLRNVGDGMRVLAKAPHAVTWIEFDFHKRFDKYLAQFSAYNGASDWNKNRRTVFKRCGWLIEEIGDDEYKAMPVMGSGNEVECSPFAYHWRTGDDMRPSVRVFDVEDTAAEPGTKPQNVARICFGTPALTDLANITYTPLSALLPTEMLGNAMLEMRGELRYVWALLASINDLPTGIRDVKPSRGFMARRNYRKFMSYSVISLVLPKRMTEARLARILVTISRRKAHEVRGHFRRVGPDKKRVWIKEHIRGDASLGWVTHSYSVKHERPEQERTAWHKERATVT